MEEPLIGWIFIIPASLVATAIVMFLWYRLLKSSENARAASVVTVIVTAPAIIFGTLMWRWQIAEFGDSPAAGLPILAAFYEVFWIWCISLLLIFALHGQFERITTRNRRREIVDDVFE
ncbi:MAG: hypothetical protein WA908_04845 [Pontixanthobacter sp.]